MTVSIQGVDKVHVFKNGVNIKQALLAANETVNKGLYDATTLSAVDADLATGNIKSGITIFGFVGSASVLDVSDADAAVGEVLAPKTFYSVTGPKKTGTMPIVALLPNNTAYPGGYHVGAASLQAIDADLTPANIKTGVNIFGYVGTYDTTVSAPLAAQVILNKVCWANGAQITGTMPTVTIASGSNSYLAGYHAGAAGLSTIEASLAAANIKSGINIFGFVGPATVQDISAANATVAQVLAANTFFSVSGIIKTGTMPTVALADANSNYPTGYHAGAANLAAIDAHLAVGNIKTGVNIFGYVGTFSQTATHDIEGQSALTGACVTGSTPAYYLLQSINAGADFDANSLTQTYAANSLAEAFGYCHCRAENADVLKIRLYMNGVQVGETASVPTSYDTVPINGYAALSGSKIVKISIHNYDVDSQIVFLLSGQLSSGEPYGAMVFAGSVKVT